MYNKSCGRLRSFSLGLMGKGGFVRKVYVLNGKDLSSPWELAHFVPSLC